RCRKCNELLLELSGCDEDTAFFLIRYIFKSYPAEFSGILSEKLFVRIRKKRPELSVLIKEFYRGICKYRMFIRTVRQKDLPDDQDVGFYLNALCDDGRYSDDIIFLSHRERSFARRLCSGMIARFTEIVPDGLKTILEDTVICEMIDRTAADEVLRRCLAENKYDHIAVFLDNVNIMPGNDIFIKICGLRVDFPDRYCDVFRRWLSEISVNRSIIDILIWKNLFSDILFLIDKKRINMDEYIFSALYTAFKCGSFDCDDIKIFSGISENVYPSRLKDYLSKDLSVLDEKVREMLFRTVCIDLSKESRMQLEKEFDFTGLKNRFGYAVLQNDLDSVIRLVRHCDKDMLEQKRDKIISILVESGDVVSAKELYENSGGVIELRESEIEFLFRDIFRGGDIDSFWFVIEKSLPGMKRQALERLLEDWDRLTFGQKKVVILDHMEDIKSAGLIDMAEKTFSCRRPYSYSYYIQKSGDMCQCENPFIYISLALRTGNTSWLRLLSGIYQKKQDMLRAERMFAVYAEKVQLLSAEDIRIFCYLLEKNRKYKEALSFAFNNLMKSPFFSIRKILYLLRRML
ncbi:MAG: hypothetical protein ACOCWO_05215, partial [Candidatus Muiribacteriaceae bacterium]